MTTAPVREWTFILFKMAGTGLADDIRTGLGRLDTAGTSPDAYVAVRAEQGGELTDYVVDGTKAASGGFLKPVAHPGMPMMREDNIKSFLVDAMQRCPAKHYYVAFEGHSHDIRHALGNVHQALSEAVQAHGGKVDVLCFDACFLAQLEAAAEFKDVASTLLASEETMAGWRPVEQAAAAPPKTAAELATFFVKHSEEFTLSALDLDKTPIEPARHLAEAIKGIAAERSLSELRGAIARSQHFFTDGIAHPDTFHNSVDVADCMQQIASNAWLSAHEPALVAAAHEMQAGLQPFVIAENHASKPTRDSLVELTDVRRAHGVSMYLPHTAPVLRDSYIHLRDSRFNAQTGFDAAIAHLTGDRNAGYVLGSAAENASGLALQGVRSAAEGAQMAADKLTPHTRALPPPRVIQQLADRDRVA